MRLKRAIFGALQAAPDFIAKEDADEGPLPNTVASQQLDALLTGTITRDEGNSCLILGPRGSGKTRLVENAIKTLKDRPIVIRLSGWAQINDRLAMREVARQLSEQTGQSYLKDEADDADAEINPFAEPADVVSLPPPSHLPALISVIPTLSRPTIVVLDAFDLFALHPRQSLLYCLLDTVQSCRAGSGSKGLAVIGVTSRIDTINLLEKRVKSRFSGRMLRTAAPPDSDYWLDVAGKVLRSPAETGQEEWQPIWRAATEEFLQDTKVLEIFRESYAMSRDLTNLCQILMNLVSRLTPKTPFPQLSHVMASVAVQRSRPRFHFLSDLPYPSLCLLVAAIHAHTAAQDIFTFEMLHKTFRDQLRSSQSAPVEVEGGGIGMIDCTRPVLRSAFEMLVASRVFVATAASSATIAAEFVKYRCVLDRIDVKKAVDDRGQTNLKRWLSKAP
ncbi:hypothetical protein HWV62_7128 [Athelia sp. TMB]|nr:hypothetical protein HWV62_7128 [Athelia sp. TMB]